MTTQIQIDGEIFKNTIKILKDLIKFKTVSGKSNLELINYCELELKKTGATSFKTFNSSKTLSKAAESDDPAGITGFKFSMFSKSGLFISCS